MLEAPKVHPSAVSYGLAHKLTLAQDSLEARDISLELRESIEVLQLPNGELSTQVKEFFFRIIQPSPDFVG
jgi:hypothetical protein